MKDYLHLILGALALLLAAFLCLRGPTPAPTAAIAPPPPVIAAPAPVPVPTPVAASARLDVLAADKKVVLEGVVRDEPTKAKLVAQAASFYGAPNVTDKLTIDDKVTALKSIVLTGEVPSDQIKTGTGDSVKAAVGPDWLASASGSRSPGCARAWRSRQEPRAAPRPENRRLISS